MLTIRKEQMNALAASLRQGFEDRMVRHFAATFPTEYKAMVHGERGEADVRGLIRRGMATAAGFGIERRKDVAGFIGLMVGISPDFLTQPKWQWAAKILHSKSIPDRARMEVIFDQLPQRHPEYEGLRCPKENQI